MKDIRLTPIENEILLMLQEAGSEDFSTIIATLHETSEEAVQGSIVSLKSKDLVIEEMADGQRSIIATESGLSHYQ